MITRRQFTGGIIGVGASLLLPRLAVRPQYDLHAMASQWCDKEFGFKWDLTKPYLFEDLVFATDGRAMVFFSDDAATADGEMRVPKNTAAVRSQFWNDDSQWGPLPSRPTLLGNTDGAFRDDGCPACMLNGSECNTCEGWGCDECCGQGFTVRSDCRICHGTNKGPSAAVLADQLIGVEYYERLLYLPGVQIHKARISEQPLMFRSECGLSGLIMPRIHVERVAT